MKSLQVASSVLLTVQLNWKHPHTFSASGDATAPAVDFNGTQNPVLNLTLNTVNSDVGTFGSPNQIAQVTVNAKGLVTGVSNVAISTCTVTG